METAVEQAVQEQPVSTSSTPVDEVLEEETALMSESPVLDDESSATDPPGELPEETVKSNGNLSEGDGTGSQEDLSVDEPAEVPVVIPEVVEKVKEVKPAKSQNNKVSSSGNSKGDKSAQPSKSNKSKKKEDKSIDHILRALNSLQTTEEKLAALCKKYADLHEEHRVLQASFKQAQRKMVVTTREKDQLQSEHTKAMMAKSKLESLCRELQKHNRIIKEESLARAREEDEKRKEISSKFQQTIGEIQSQMTDNHERNVKLREDNTELAGKLKKFVEQYELREQQVEKIVQHRELEKQLGEAKLAQSNAMLKEQEERAGKEREFLLIQAAEAQKKAQVVETQLTMYKDRYEEFQSTINRSNEMFGKFKSEMDKMGKRIKKLEKEGAQWKAKWENSNRALLGMVDEKTKSDKEKGVLLTKVSKLESLCRALQSELHGKKETATTDGIPEKDAKEDKGEPTATPPNTPETTSRNSPVKEEETPSETGEATPPVPSPSVPPAEGASSNTESKPPQSSELSSAEDAKEESATPEVQMKSSPVEVEPVLEIPPQEETNDTAKETKQQGDITSVD